MKILCVLLGTVIGAGFISGAEINLFFNNCGHLGIFGILIASIIFCITIYLCLKSNSNSYLDLINKNINSGIIKKFLNIIITSFLIVSYFIMIAGLTSFLNSEFNISYFLSSIISVSIVFLIIKGNINRIEKFNLIFVPILIITIFILGLRITNIPALNLGNQDFNYSFLLLAITYASYNSISLIPIVLNFKSGINISKGKPLLISILFSFITFLCGIIIYFLIESNPYSIYSSIPMLQIIKNAPFALILLVKLSIVFSILSTAISVEHSAITNISKNDKSYMKYILILDLIAIFTSYIGFQNLIKIFYPIFGVIGLYNFIILIKNYIKNVKYK